MGNTIDILDSCREKEAKATTEEAKEEIEKEYLKQLSAIDANQMLNDILQDRPELIIAMKEVFQARRLDASLQKAIRPPEPFIEMMDKLPFEAKANMAQSIEINPRMSLAEKAIQLSLLFGRKELAHQQQEAYIASEHERLIEPFVLKAQEAIARKKVAKEGGKARNRTTNLMKSKAQDIARTVWNFGEEESPPMIGTVAEWIRAELVKEGSNPPADKIIRKWISDIAPPEAKKAGRPKKLKP